MPTNPDFRDLLSELNAAGAEFLVVAAHAVMFFTEPRFTKDLDIWVGCDRRNAVRVHRALETFGAPLTDLSVDDLSVEGTIFQIGVPPNRIDVLTSIAALDFPSAHLRAVATSYGGVPIWILSAEDLITNKRAVGRKQDEIDVEKLLGVLAERSR